jgi:hypothetical protein
MNGRRPPRLPGWVLLVGTLVVLGAATWLFVAEGRDDDPQAATERTTESPRAEEELQLPSSDEPTDTRRRGEDGRSRIDRDDASGDGDGGEAAVKPATFRNLRGVTVALGPASATADRPGRAVRIGAIRTTCGGPRDVDALAIELALLDRVELMLEASGARVSRLDEPQSRTVPCRDVRARLLGNASWSLVVSATGRAPAADYMAPARSTRPETTGSEVLVAELAGALDLTTRPTTSATRAARRSAALRAGSVMLPDAGPSAFYHFAGTGLDSEALDDRARQLVIGLAAAVTRSLASGPGAAPEARASRP